MSKPFRTSLGLIILVTTIFVASCQSMVNAISSNKQAVSLFEPKQN